MEIILSICSTPSTESCFPGWVLDLFNFLVTALYKISFTKEDFPDPDTPVTAVKVERGNFTSIPFKLFCLAFFTSIYLSHFLLSFGTGIFSFPER